MRTIFALFAVVLIIPLQAQERAGYYRFPALHGSTVVFTSEGDLWSVAASGGIARRLTTHGGMETNAAISPDGKLVAFSGQYEGPTEVYTMPVNGGLPTRRTFSGQPAYVVGWTPDGRVLYTTRKYSTLPNYELVALDLAKGSESLLPLSQAAEGTYGQDGRTLFFTRLPFQGSYTKRYQGGTAQQIWSFTTGAAEAVPLTVSYAGTSKNPMWWNGRVYFISDRDGTMNLWSMKEDGSDPRQLTTHKGFDVSAASLDDGRIVYQRVADLYLYDIAAGSDTPLDVRLSSDFEQTREKWVKNPMEFLSSAHISPTGDRVALTSRGNVFVAPSGQGRLARVSQLPGVRHRIARFFADGKSLLALSDASGEQEFHRLPANGVGKDEQLTSGAKVLRFDGVPSPDGKKVAYSDKDYQLWLYDVAKKTSERIAVSGNDMFNDLSWSPDSRWLAFTEQADNLFTTIRIYDAVSRTFVDVTNDRVDSYSPTWSPDGKWLYFLSDRQFVSVVGSPWGARQPEPYFDKTTKVYAVSLTGKERFPFLPADEISSDTTGKASSAKPPKSVVVTIDTAGLEERLYEVPIPAGSYADLSVNEKALFFIDRLVGAPAKRGLQALEIKAKDVTPKTLVEDMSGYELSADGKKILVSKQNELYVIDAGTTPPAKIADTKIDLSRWAFSIDTRAEWRQMLIDAWRLERDYFYDRNMHGVDYEGLLKRHLPLVERVSDRAELGNLIAHLVGELSALHTYVYGGDMRKNPDDVQIGSLGATLDRDEASGGYRVRHIYRVNAEYPDRIPPLARPSVVVSEGDVITAVNGVSALSVPDIALLLRNTAGQQVLLDVRAPASGAHRQVVVVPVNGSVDADLRYEEWEYTRRVAVEHASNNSIGYVHLRAMGNSNYTEWVKNFYPVFDRKGLIIDVRHNGGGNIDSWILEKLLRKAWFFWQPRVGNPYWNMQFAFRGHLVVLCDEWTASDGEAFAEGFRRLGLGKVIGTRTWGGEIWLSSSNNLVDRGIATAAEFGVYSPDREWLIEGHGVVPDVVVDNLPHATFEGNDAQLEAAIAYLREKIRTEPVTVPPAPAYPDKGRH